MSDKGLDFSKIKSFSCDDGIVYKDNYYNSNINKYKKSTTKNPKVSPAVKTVLVLAMKCKRDYEGAVELLKNRGLGTIKESYWDMAKRVGSYGEDALKSWIAKSNPISYYKENYN